ncbi:MAG: ABC transporter permease [Nanoarchaeota archaeon]|nr:ABC transporter permease [Nanoarchaeota archaeon]
MRIIELIRKNFLRMARNRVSTLLILLSPLILVLLLTISLEDTELQRINMGYVGAENESMLDFFLDNIRSKNIFLQEEKTVEDCIERMKVQELHLCLQFPKESNKRVNIYIDYSRISLAYQLLGLLEQKTEETADLLSFEIIDSLLLDLEQISETIGQESSRISQVSSQGGDLKSSLNNSKSIIKGLDINETALGLDQDLSQFRVDPALLNSYEGRIDEITGMLLENLDQGAAEIENSRDSLETLKSLRDRGREQIQDEMSAQDCQIKNFKNALKIKGKNVTIDGDYTGYDVSCTILYTLSETFRMYTEDIDEAMQRLDSVHGQISDGRSEIKSFDRESDGTFDSLKGRVTELNNAIDEASQDQERSKEEIAGIKTMRESIMSDLERSEQSIDEVLSQIALFQNSTEGIVHELETLGDVQAIDLINPLSIKAMGINEDMSTIEFFFPSLIVMLALFISLILSSVLVVKEKSSSAFFRNNILHVNPTLFITGFIITTTILVTVILTLVFLFANVVLSLSLYYNYWVILFILLVSNIIFSLIGLFIGYLMDNEESAVITAVIMSTVFFIFSGLIFPFEIMKPALVRIFSLSPYVLAESLIKKSVLYNIPLSQAIGDMILLVIEFVVLFFLVLLAYKKSKRRL